MQNNAAIPTKTLVLISLAQGLVLLILHQALVHNVWPQSSPPWLFSFYSIALIAPTMLLLSLNTTNMLATTKYILAYTVILGGLSFYIGWQATPTDYIPINSLFFAYITTMLIASFKALMYIQQGVSGKAFSYSQLYSWSWRNFLTLVLALLFAACFWGVLMLWAGLFKAIKINFFYALFTKSWFYYPAISLAHGFGIIMFRNLSNVIDTITRLQQALMKFLLVLLAFVSILFLAALPISGLAPLWETGGSMLILWMQALMLFFINAVYQDDAKVRPYNIWLHRFIYFGVALLPIYSIISFYGLSIRVDQYGWSLTRCWGFLIWFLLALFPLGYLYGILKLRDNWLEQLSKVNVVIGLVVFIAVLLTNSPLLDFRKIVAHNQIQRVEQSQRPIEELDIRYFKRELARSGYIALRDLKHRHPENSELTQRINRLYAKPRPRKPKKLSKQDVIDKIIALDHELPVALVNTIYKAASKRPREQKLINNYYSLPLDLNLDDKLEYLLIKAFDTRISLKLYVLQNNQWVPQNMSPLNTKNLIAPTLIETLKSQGYETTPPEWQNLRIGDHTFYVK